MHSAMYCGIFLGVMLGETAIGGSGMNNGNSAAAARRLKAVFWVFMGLWLASFPALAGDWIVVAAAGYKRPVLELIERYRALTGQTVVGGFGNMQQISAQAQASADVGLMLGDEAHLRDLPFVASLTPLGVGKLVLAWPKGKAALSADADLLAPGVGRIACPDAKKAIYGIAASEWMKNKGLAEALKPKLIEVATVPQVTSYLISAEVDAGFINLTDALGAGDKIGGYRVIESGYTTIRIVAGVIKGHENGAQVKGFLTFMNSPDAAAILKAYGM